ncbi:hypothetical protein V8D89_005252 [Ganoderma adspersum]
MAEVNCKEPRFSLVYQRLARHAHSWTYKLRSLIPRTHPLGNLELLKLVAPSEPRIQFKGQPGIGLEENDFRLLARHSSLIDVPYVYVGKTPSCTWTYRPNVRREKELRAIRRSAPNAASRDLGLDTMRHTRFQRKILDCYTGTIGRATRGSSSIHCA